MFRLNATQLSAARWVTKIMIIIAGMLLNNWSGTFMIYVNFCVDFNERRRAYQQVTLYPHCPDAIWLHDRLTTSPRTIRMLMIFHDYFVVRKISVFDFSLPVTTSNMHQDSSCVIVWSKFSRIFMTCRDFLFGVHKCCRRLPPFFKTSISRGIAVAGISRLDVLYDFRNCMC